MVSHFKGVCQRNSAEELVFYEQELWELAVSVDEQRQQ